MEVSENRTQSEDTEDEDGDDNDTKVMTLVRKDSMKKKGRGTGNTT